MNKLNVKIENCYGITNLIKEFDFTDGNNTFAIYAPNGVMKTSFANVFQDFSLNMPSQDLIYTKRVSLREIKDENGYDLNPESIFVIKSYDSKYRSAKISTLLVNEELRKEYERLHKNIENYKIILLKELNALGKLKGSIENEISTTFTGENEQFYQSLEPIKSKLELPEIYNFSHIEFSRVFDSTIIDFLNTKDFKVKIKAYIEKYEDLVNKSKYLKKDFNHYNAETVQKNLKDQGFFKAKHSINLADSEDNKVEITSEEELLALLKLEKDKILENPELKSLFDEIDKKIKNVQLREFREYLFANKDILTELNDIEAFREKVLLSYFKACQESFTNLYQEYTSSSVEIKKIIEQAKLESTQWENVIKIFNRRFFVPFNIKIKNKEDIILKNTAPAISYHFDNQEESIDENLLITSVLSQGEKRAFYLLNIIFEIESRKKLGINTILIVDDIADSFDYKNKYAIVEYLNDIASDGNFKMILLSHNFDFFRTIQERIGMNKWQKSLIAIKNDMETKLETIKYSYISNPLKEWKSQLNNKVVLVSAVTFARNIAEYTGDKANFTKLTSVLHQKSDTKLIKIKDIFGIMCSIFQDLQGVVLSDQERLIHEIIIEEADKICVSPINQGLNLENKILMSIAIRLLAEEHMINRINDQAYIATLKKDQTGRLLKKYKELFGNTDNKVEVLDRVCLITPENIHLNSFMFEPILDMSELHLNQLYSEVKQL